MTEASDKLKGRSRWDNRVKSLLWRKSHTRHGRNRLKFSGSRPPRHFFTDMIINCIFASKRRKMPFNFPFVVIILVQEKEAYKTEEKQDGIFANILGAQEFSQEQVRAACTVAFKPLSETFVIVWTDRKITAWRHSFKQIEQRYSCKVACGVTDVLPRSRFYVIVTNAWTFVVTLAKIQRVATTNPRISEVLHIKNDQYSAYLPPSSVGESAKVGQYEPSPISPDKWIIRKCPANWRRLS